MALEGGDRGRVALFVTCLADLMRPSVGFASAALLERAGFEVIVPSGQTCCGQPNFNGGDHAGARAMASRTIELLMPYEKVVVPSGSCAAMIVRHYPALFAADDPQHEAAKALAARTFELTQFLAQCSAEGLAERLAEAPRAPVPATEGAARVTYHDSCSGLRELGIKAEPRALMAAEPSIELVEMERPEECCGFGGAFCLKFPAISGRMADRKTQDTQATRAKYVAMGDVGCLLNIEGKLHREGSDLKAVHIAELLAGRLPE